MKLTAEFRRHNQWSSERNCNHAIIFVFSEQTKKIMT